MDRPDTSRRKLSLDESIFYKHIRLPGAAEVCSLHESFANHPSGRAGISSIRSFTLDNTGSEAYKTSRSSKLAFVGILHRAHGLDELVLNSTVDESTTWTALGQPPPREEVYDLLYRLDCVKFLPRLRLLDVPAPFLLCLSAPRPSVTHLSVRVRHKIATETYSKIAMLFGPALFSLRVRRTFEGECRQDSPARICAEITAPRLRYLEVEDTMASDQHSVGHGDVICGTPLHASCAGNTPSLVELVWAPAWRRAVERPLHVADRRLHAFLISLDAFSRDLADVFCRATLLVILDDTRGVRFGGNEEDRHQGKLEEWAADLRNTRWRGI